MDTAGSRAEMRAEVQSYDVICSMSWLSRVACALFPGKSPCTSWTTVVRGRSAGARSRFSPTSSKKGPPQRALRQIPCSSPPTSPEDQEEVGGGRGDKKFQSSLFLNEN